MRWPLEIQLFGDETDNSEDDSNQQDNVDQQQDKPKAETKPAFSQQDIDDAVTKAVKEAKDQWDAQQKEKQSEAQKLAKMSKEERGEYETQKKEKELADREAELSKRELMSTAKESLIDKGLPIELAAALDYKDADACNKSINAIGKVFEDAVQKAVEDRIKGGKPMKKASTNATELTDEELIYKNMMGK
ncbi:MAG: DUF4355 domain-containing protein [Erysipelotrichaceae bacterium]|nr:DUF4355 domain-containing protein [Erysipelotrichaceae bacterium]